MTEPNYTNWRKSTKSSGGGNCIEIAHDEATVGVRDTKDRTGGTLVFSTEGWQTFLDAIHQGEINLS